MALDRVKVLEGVEDQILEALSKPDNEVEDLKDLMQSYTYLMDIVSACKLQELMSLKVPPQEFLGRVLGSGKEVVN